MKIKGSELIAFLREGWPQPEDDWYWDHDVFDEPNPGETYDTDEIGGIHFQGGSEDPTKGEGYDLAALIRRWRKNSTHKVITVSIPKDRFNEFKSFLKSIGGSI